MSSSFLKVVKIDILPLDNADKMLYIDDMEKKAKATKAVRIREWKKSHKTWSNASIGRMFRVSREYVRQVVTKENKKAE